MNVSSMTPETCTKIMPGPKATHRLSPRKTAIRDLADRMAPSRASWIAKNAYFYEEDYRYMRFLIPEGLSVLDLGCGTGQLLAALKPSRGIGIDFSPKMVEIARDRYSQLEFHVGDVENPNVIADINGTFDVIVLSDTIGSLDDCQATLEHLHRLCTSDTRIIIAYYSHTWGPLLRIAQLLGFQMPQVPQNWLSTDDIRGLLALADFEVIKRDWRQLVPQRLFGLGRLINKYVAPIAGIRRTCLRNYVVARSLVHVTHNPKSATIVVPCRNEKGNIEAAVRRIPRFCEDIEILFVEGHSQDGTLEEIHRVMATRPDLDIKVFVQDGKGKGDAVRKGFAKARGEILIILDADLTTPPEDLGKFHQAITSGKGEFINGSRLVYPMEQQAMRFLNLIANQVFSWLFTWLLNQRFTDTLCGTKVLSKHHYQQIANNRHYFGDFDPFGDFDLLFGAAKLNLKIVEIPIRYDSRTYGETNISRFRHGLLLFRMVIFAFRKLKAF